MSFPYINLVFWSHKISTRILGRMRGIDQTCRLNDFIFGNVPLGWLCFANGTRMIAANAMPEYAATVAATDFQKKDTNVGFVAVHIVYGCPNSAMRTMASLISCPGVRLCAAHIPCTVSHSLCSLCFSLRSGAAVMERKPMLNPSFL